MFSIQSKESNDPEASLKIQQFANHIRKRQKLCIMETIRNKLRSEEDKSEHNYPLTSKTLQRFHDVAHSDIWKYLEDISKEIEENNMYLSLEIEEEKEEGNYELDEQTLLVNDLFYLVFEHGSKFKFPRKIKFIHNKDPLTASFASIVSTQMQPEELSYWINYMNDEDLDIVYLGLISDEKEGNPFHYLSWINLPSLRHHILDHFQSHRTAAKGLREIIGFKYIHPNRLKNGQGETVYEIICQNFLEEIEGMNFLESDSRETKLFSEHLEICVKTIVARKLEEFDTENNCEELIDLLSKIIKKKISVEPQLISPLFCLWVMDALLVDKIFVLTKEAYEILVSVIQYDPQFTHLNEKDLECVVINEEKIKAFFECLNENEMLKEEN